MKDSAPITFNIEPHAITLLSEMGVVQEQEGGERLPPAPCMARRKVDVIT